MSDRIKISREFKDNILGSLWLGLERDIEPESDISESFRISNEELMAAYEYLGRTNGHPYANNLSDSINWTKMPYGENIQQLTPQDEKINSYIATIELCPSIPTLERFKIRVDEEKNDLLTLAYNKKHSELLNKQS